MHNVNKLVASISMVALLSPLALSAKTVEQIYVDSYQGARPEVPVPVAVVSPTPIPETEGNVELTFIVNTQGMPTDIVVKAATNELLVAPAKEAIAQWKFSPAKYNGEVVARKVTLPLRFLAAD